MLGEMPPNLHLLFLQYLQLWSLAHASTDSEEGGSLLEQ